ncbi:hypothetical protein I551_2620 [Mycobacterium ulcerans str. Harvey]|uniref:Uncharacterized protein n=1 Tax=Mycobacterium ulcerans str. Harvey TaxID=1299332 RepID=A0ABP3ALV7_MYCUL|nr:hypothetical protein I551_2620 [Mycobacterium ulcerans str. Harvey]
MEPRICSRHAKTTGWPWLRLSVNATPSPPEPTTTSRLTVHRGPHGQVRVIY